MPRNKLVLPPVPVEVACLNCDKTFEVLKTAKLFCRDICRDDAKLVRYFRRRQRDGRINEPDIQQAIGIRIAFAMSELGYDEKSRKLNPEERAAVFKRDHGKCCQCGAEGTEVDHIKGPSNDMSNLQLLCQSCHFQKTEENMRQLSLTDDRNAKKKLRYIMLMKRVYAEKPLRKCDDDVAWNDKPLMKERFQAMQNARLLAMRDRAIRELAQSKPQ